MGDRLLVVAKAPGDFCFIQSGRYLGDAFTSAMRFLLFTGIFASLLSFHHTIARYIRGLSEEGILLAALARLHPKYGSPYRASLLQTGLVCVPLGLFIASGSDPFSVAFFRMTKKDTRVWHSIVAPVMGGIGPTWIGAMLVGNLDALSGSDSPVVRAFAWGVFGVALIGVEVGLMLRCKRPEVFARFGQ